MDSVEKNTKSYLVSNYDRSDTTKDFYNISTFAKNMVIKDSKKYEDEENYTEGNGVRFSLSKWFGNMLIEYCEKSLTDNEIYQLLSFIKTYNSTVSDVINKIDNNDELCKYFPNVKIKISDEETTEDDSKTSNDPVFKCNLDQLKKIIIKKESIYYEIDKDSFKIEKRSASLDERSYIENGAPLVFFDIHLTTFNDELKKLINEMALNSNILRVDFTRNNENESNIHIIILYKELNPKYRDDLNINDIETALFRPTVNKETGEIATDGKGEIKYNELEAVLKLFSSKKDGSSCITRSSVEYLRSIEDDAFFIKDNFKDDENNDEEASIEDDDVSIKNNKKILVSTNKLFKYGYGNPYTARRANESDIIYYYYGDNYISNGYGKYGYEKEEISDFLRIYQETRDYYYRVLLNESFINEDGYKTYEKIFIIFWSIERFITGKLDRLMDFDSYSENDVKNFLESYGMADLSYILDGGYGSVEPFAKKLLKNYKELVQNKGSREVINILEDIFSIDSSELKVYRNLLVKEIKGDDKPSYKMVQVDYSDNSILKSILESLSSSPTVEEFTKGDKYWKKELGNDTKDLIPPISTTKYLTAEFTNELSKGHILTGCTLAILDYVLGRIESKLINSTSKDDDYNKLNGNTFFAGMVYLNNPDIFVDQQVSLLDALSALREMMSRYYSRLGINNVFSSDGNKKIYTFKFNPKPGNNVLKLDLYEDKTHRDSDTKDIIEKLNKAIDAINILKDIDSRITFDSNNGSTEGDKKDDGNLSSVIEDALIIPNLLIGLELYNINISSTLLNKIIKIYESCYLSDGNNKVINAPETGVELTTIVNETFLGTTADELKSAILNYLEFLNDSLGTLISYNLIDATDTLLAFIKEAITFFISYTTEVYGGVAHIKTYNNRLERMLLVDSYESEITTVKVDSFFYDEELFVTEDTKKEV